MRAAVDLHTLFYYVKGVHEGVTGDGGAGTRGCCRNLLDSLGGYGLAEGRVKMVPAATG